MTQSSDKKKPFIIVDGSSYLFRAYYALPPLNNSRGEPTGAIYGVINMLRRLMKDYQPEHMAVVFDSKEKTFRHHIYPAYKANRAVMPEDLVVQIKPLHEIIRALGMPLIVEAGIEADDVIATLVHIAQKHGLKSIVSTSDKDLAQLVNDNITLVNTMTGQVLDIKGVQEKFGVLPERMVDYLTLVGDTSDNIMGVPKVGPKTAVKWLQEYGSLGNIIKHAEKFSGKVGENLRESLKNLALTQELVTVKDNVALDVLPENLVLKSPEKEKLLALFSHLEFKNWLREIGGAEEKEEAEKTHSVSHSSSHAQKPVYETIFDEKVLKKWGEKIEKSPYFSLDTETTSLNAMEAELVGISFSVKKGEAAYVPLAHSYEGVPAQLKRETVLAWLKPFIENENKIIIGQNLKYDYKVLGRYEAWLKSSLYDTLLESYVLNTTTTRHDLATLAKDYLNRTVITYDQVTTGIKGKDFSKVRVDKASEYSAEDAEVTLELHQTLMLKINEDKELKAVLEKIELPLLPVLARMEFHGVLIDIEKLKQQSHSIAIRLSHLEEKIYKEAESTFNISSSKQLQDILYKKMKLPILKKTPTGQPSTAEFVLEALALDYTLPKFVLEFRSLSKLKTTYTDRLPEQVNSQTGRIHTSYLQAVTATGRLASKDPNLQNIPARTEEGRKIRQAFIVPQGYRFISADYSQIELRIMAHLSKDPMLLQAFAEGRDIHRATASEVFGVPYEKVDDEQRRQAKAVNFGLLYGMSAFGLAQQIGIERSVAAEYIDVYFSRYPKVKLYIDDVRKEAKRKGYVRTLFGRKILVPDVISKNSIRRKAAERAAINAPLQGTAADIIKLAMIEMDRMITKLKLNAFMIMQVHDELVFEVAVGDEEVMKKNIQEVMENAIELSVPLVVDVGVGKNWDEAH